MPEPLAQDLGGHAAGQQHGCVRMTQSVRTRRREPRGGDPAEEVPAEAVRVNERAVLLGVHPIVGLLSLVTVEYGDWDLTIHTIPECLRSGTR